MSCREVDLATVVIDSLGFAAEGGRVAGRLALAALPRLADALTNRAGGLDCELSGWRAADQATVRLGLRLQVAGRLWLRCQRCLDEVAFDCAIDRRLLLVPEGAAWPEEELEADDYDAIPAAREQSVLALVEEEVLLALPAVPRHAECCSPAAEAGEAEEESRPSPFAALAGLRKH